MTIWKSYLTRQGEVTAHFVLVILGLLLGIAVDASGASSIIEDLSHPLWTTRHQAALAAPEHLPYSEDLTNALRGALRDPVWDVRKAAAAALGRGTPTPEVVADLIEGLDDGSVSVRGAVTEALIEIGLPSVHLLIRALEPPNAKRRETIHEVLARIGAASPEVLTAVAELLVHPDHRLRLIGLSVLSDNVREYEWIAPAILELVASESNLGSLRAAGVRELAQPSLLSPSLVSQVAAHIHDSVTQVRLNTVLVLDAHSMDYPDLVIPHLATALRDEDHQVAVASAQALARLGPLAEQALPALIRVREDSAFVLRQAASSAIAAIGPGRESPDEKWLTHLRARVPDVSIYLVVVAIVFPQCVLLVGSLQRAKSTKRQVFYGGKPRYLIARERERLVVLMAILVLTTSIVVIITLGGTFRSGCFYH